MSYGLCIKFQLFDYMCGIVHLECKFRSQIMPQNHAPQKKAEGAISIQASSRELEEGRCVELFPGHLRSQIQEPEPGSLGAWEPRFGYDGHPAMDKC